MAFMSSGAMWRMADVVGKCFKNVSFGEYKVAAVDQDDHRAIRLCKAPSGVCTNISCSDLHAAAGLADLVHKNQNYPRVAHLERDKIRDAVLNIMDGRSADMEVECDESSTNLVPTTRLKTQVEMALELQPEEAQHTPAHLLRPAQAHVQTRPPSPMIKLSSRKDKTATDLISTKLDDSTSSTTTALDKVSIGPSTASALKQANFEALMRRMTSLEHANKEMVKTIAEHNTVIPNAIKAADPAALLRRINTLEAANKDLTKTIAERGIIIDSKLEHARDRNEALMDYVHKTAVESIIDSVVNFGSERLAGTVAEHFKAANAKLKECIDGWKDATKEAKDEMLCLRDDEENDKELVATLTETVDELRSELEQVKQQLSAPEKIQKALSDVKTLCAELLAAHADYEPTSQEVYEAFKGVLQQEVDSIKQPVRDTIEDLRIDRDSTAGVRKKLDTLFELVQTDHHDRIADMQDLERSLAAKVDKLEAKIYTDKDKTRKHFEDLSKQMAGQDNEALNVFERQDAYLVRNECMIKDLRDDCSLFKKDVQARSEDVEQRSRNIQAKLKLELESSKCSLEQLRNMMQDDRASHNFLVDNVAVYDDDITNIKADVMEVKAALRLGEEGDEEEQATPSEGLGALGQDSIDGEGSEDSEDFEIVSQCDSDFELLGDGLS
ncbi:hypothetical protein LTR78_000041 [Recurvomyces mirabilis]|uniref:Uncharacterized protein n=1 Tax=Recurvomyces mirabilis TaxID=574656 RepID=A0AAE0WXE6_9PEZI|nr:hypothetical protein LTR78_000041 [Recurvomyces mirabilis]KAK5161698.1 hypothetical protein LTS14_000042 [Recurvomyces mirabilis]